MYVTRSGSDPDSVTSAGAQETSGVAIKKVLRLRDAVGANVTRRGSCRGTNVKVIHRHVRRGGLIKGAFMC